MLRDRPKLPTVRAPQAVPIFGTVVVGSSTSIRPILDRLVGAVSYQLGLKLAKFFFIFQNLSHLSSYGRATKNFHCEPPVLRGRSGIPELSGAVKGHYVGDPLGIDGTALLTFRPG